VPLDPALKSGAYGAYSGQLLQRQALFCPKNDGRQPDHLISIIFSRIFLNHLDEKGLKKVHQEKKDETDNSYNTLK
jgi:hypothetical protein